MVGKLYRDMTDEEKARHRENVKKYRQGHPVDMDAARKASLKYYYADPARAAVKAKRWREANLEYILVKQREDKRKRKLEAIEYLGGKCQQCEKMYHPSQYEFHHTNPAEKDRDPSKMLQLSKVRLLAELDKCQLLCANCHRYTHHGEKY